MLNSCKESEKFIFLLELGDQSSFGQRPFGGISGWIFQLGTYTNAVGSEQYVETGPFIVTRGIVLPLFPTPEDVTKVGVSVAPETHSKSYRSVWYHPDIWEQQGPIQPIYSNSRPQISPSYPIIPILRAKLALPLVTFACC